MGESFGIFHHSSFSLSGTEASSLDSALFVAATQAVLCKHGALPSFAWTLRISLVQFLLPPRVCSRNRTPRRARVPVVKLCLAWDAGVFPFHVWEHQPCQGGTVWPQSVCTAPTTSGLRVVTESAGRCCCANE